MPGRAALVLVSVLVLPAAAARADFPTHVPRATLVEVLSGGKQALVLDRSSGDYEVVKVGDSVQGFRVTDIEKDQIVLAGSDTPERYYVLPLAETAPAAPGGASAKTSTSTSSTSTGAPVSSVLAPAGSRTGSLIDPYAVGAAAPASGASSPVLDPYATGPTGAAAPASGSTSPVLDPYAVGATGAAAPAAGSSSPVLDPYGPRPAIKSVVAPPRSRAGTPAPGSPDTAAAPASPHPADPPTSAPAPARVTAVPPTVVRAGSARSAAGPSDQTSRLSRRELDHELSDFAALAREVQIEHAAGGGVLIRQIGRGSLFDRLGLRPGDVVRRVAGHTIDTPDDAADAYAAVVSATDVLVEIDRHGAPVRLHLQLTD